MSEKFFADDRVLVSEEIKKMSAEERRKEIAEYESKAQSYKDTSKPSERIIA